MATAVTHDNLTASDVVRTIEGNVRWSGTLTFNFVDTAAEATEFAEESLDNSILPAEWVAHIETSLATYRDIIPLDIVTTTTLANTDFLVGRDFAEEALGSANGPILGLEPDVILIVNFNISDAAHTAGSERGGGGDWMQTIVHELGHTLGLNHPHEAIDGATASPTAADESVFGANQPYIGHQTVMSYEEPPNLVDADGTPLGFDFGRAISPMAVDIAALHRLYGANMQTRTGDTTYRLTDAQSADLDILSSDDAMISVGRAYFGIWDAGTTDTDTIRYDGEANTLINLMTASPNGGDIATENATAAARLARIGALDNLSAEAQSEITTANMQIGGFFSSVLNAEGTRIQGGYSIAQGVVIETASGGSGNDTLIGNSADNTLIGNGGDDVMAGGAGDDIARYTGVSSGHTVAREGEAIMIGGASGADRLYDIEALAFDDAFVLLDTTTTLSATDVGTLGYLYEAGLNRNGALDVAGLEFWIGARENGLTEDEMAGYFLNSAEFATRNGAPDTLSDRALVEALYRNTLDRDGETAGIDFWTGIVGRDTFSRNDLLLAFAESDENKASAPALSVFDDAIA